VLITGAYIGRLLFAVYFGPLRTTSHHRESWLLTLPLAPLAIAALLAGYLEWPSGALSSSLGYEAHLQGFGVIGLLAGVLGLGGMGLGWLLARRPAPSTQAGWTGPVGAAGYFLSSRMAALQSGRLTSYVLASLLGIAVILFLAARS
jgi:NADH:ubiquinone oxidoreductase subunit 5 (subunit L)/multisubunit Na+/H+ antiporter MnhA subunit